MLIFSYLLEVVAYSRIRKLLMGKNFKNGQLVKNDIL
jgi:hypothetical protein